MDDAVVSVFLLVGPKISLAEEYVSFTYCLSSGTLPFFELAAMNTAAHLSHRCIYFCKQGCNVVQISTGPKHPLRSDPALRVAGASPCYLRPKAGYTCTSRQVIAV